MKKVVKKKSQKTRPKKKKKIEIDNHFFVRISFALASNRKEKHSGQKLIERQ